MKRIAALAAAFALVIALLPAPASRGQKWFEKAVKKVEAKFAPAEAKPGQTVTFTVTFELDRWLPYLPDRADRQAGRGDGEHHQVSRNRTR